MNDKKLHWGVIGCGHVVEKKSGPAFYRLPNTELTAVMCRTRENAKKYAEQHHVKKYYSDADELINDPEVEAIYIATPPYSHAELTIKAIEKGKPVYVEKPMAISYAECIKMEEAAFRTGIPLYVAYYRRAMEYFIKVKTIISNNLLGDIYHIKLHLVQSSRLEDLQKPIPWRLNYVQSGGGYFVDMGAHQIDLLLYLFGPIIKQESIVKNKGGLYDVEDYVEATFYFASGIIANALWYFTAPQGVEEDYIEVTGTAGKLYFSTFSMSPIRLFLHNGEQIYPISKPEVVEEPMIKQITLEILTDHTSTSGLKDAVEVTRLMEEILTPYYQK